MCKTLSLSLFPDLLLEPEVFGFQMLQLLQEVVQVLGRVPSEGEKGVGGYRGGLRASEGQKEAEEGEHGEEGAE